ncbi:hypothetical protein [Lampropedia hyalina]|jgi:hypothetical protein|nr:hypothetical protein [Lampropedia hyalina]
MAKEMVSISGSGKVTTYNWMLKSARVALEFAREKEEGRFFQAMNVLVYSAFAVEAYFNHLGAHLDSNWESKERKLSKFKKLRQFNERLELNQDLSKEPFRSVMDVFDFRDALAHGKTEEVERQETVELSEDELRSYMIGTKWMDACTLENAARIFSNVEEAIRQLHKAAGLGEYPFIHYHSSAYSLA